MMPDVQITTREDARGIESDVEAVVEGWYPPGTRVDWQDFLDRLEKRGMDLGDSMSSPAIEEIKKMVRNMRKAS
jgi:predicted SpoU family rRNA methylase